MFTQPKTKGLDLKYFAIHRPVIREVLNFNLNPIIYTDKIKKIQHMLGKNLPDIY